jgi:hypothetical protein
MRQAIWRYIFSNRDGNTITDEGDGDDDQEKPTDITGIDYNENEVNSNSDEPPGIMMDMELDDIEIAGVSD